MSVRVLVAKYVPDHRRAEPRNVGVLLTRPEGPATVQFMGQRDDGSVDGRTVPAMVRDLEAYKLWVAFWEEAAADGDAAISRLAESNTDSYYVVDAGEIIQDPQIENLEALTNRYFHELVAPPSAEEPSAALELATAVERLIQSPAITENVQVRRDYSVRITVKEHPVDLRFQYAFVNGHVTVGQRVLLSDESRAYGALGRAKYLPDEFSPSVAFVLTEELADVGDDSSVFWLLDAGCKVIQADLATAEEDLARAVGLGPA